MKILCFFVSCLIVTYVNAQNSIMIDGFFDDWSGNLNTYFDDSTDSQGVELLSFTVCNDNEYRPLLEH